MNHAPLSRTTAAAEGDPPPRSLATESHDPSLTAPARPSRVAIASAAAFAGVLTIGWRFLTFSGFNNDHYVHLSRAQQILFGEWPVRDFVDPGMPLMYAVHAAVRAAFGPALGVEWALVAFAFAIGAACTVIAATRLSGFVSVALVLTAFQVVLSPRSFGYPKILLYAVAALVIMALARRLMTRALVVAGAMTAVAFLFRHDHGMFIGFASLTAIVVGSYREGRRRMVERSAIFAATVAIVLLPWAAFVQHYQGLINYFVSAVGFTQGEAIDHGLRAIPRLQFGELDTTRNALVWLFYTFHALPIACVVLLIRRRSEPDAWPGETAVVAALSAMAIPVNITFLRGSLDGRVADAIVPAALLGSWLIGLALRRTDRMVPIVASGIVVAITAWASVRTGDLREQLDKTELLHGPAIVRLHAADLWDRLHRRVPEGGHVPSRYSRALLPFIEYVRRCTPPQDRLLVTGLFPEINVIAERGFAGGQMAFQPGFYGNDAEQAQTIARLQQQSVPFAIIVRKLFPDLKRQLSGVMEYIDLRYAPMAHIPVPETDGVDVLVDRGRQSARVDAATGWPCFE